ncbi:DUF1669 domain-containing protein [bacterium]|nr:DUF1669 domain-containing protein [bacterium]
MKKHFTTLFLLSLLVAFLTFLNISSKTRTVRSVISPTKIIIDTNSKNTHSNETYCIDGIDAFSLEYSEDFINKYTQKYNLTQNEFISLGYLAQDYAQKTLLNQKVRIKLGTNVSKECKYASISLNGIDYKKALENSGFGIVNDNIKNLDKFKHNLELARKLNLVILNHHSNKYHTLDCPYGNIAHDKVILPKSQLPENTIPCKFCHTEKPKTRLIKDNDIIEIPSIIQPSLQISNGEITTYITDFTKVLKPTNTCNTSACIRLLSEIDNSNSTIDIALYGYREVPEITSALKRAKSRGVRIRYVYDSLYDTSRNYYPDNEVIEKLASSYRSDRSSSQTLSNMLMHNKFLIFDNKTVYTGSMNLSSTGTSGFDINSIIIIKSKEVANLYTKEFEQMLNGKFHTEKNIFTTNRKFLLDNSEIEIYFSPKDKPTNRILELIKNAKTYIYIPTFLITHNEIATELINAHNRGVDVRIIIDANSVTTRNTKHSQLRKSGIMLKTENYAGKLHAKTMIIDDTYFVSGSMNFSNSGANKNDENLVIIKDKDIAKLHRNFFLYLWTIIPNKYLHKNAKPESPDSIGSCSDGIDNNFNNKTDNEEDYCKI